MKSRRSPRRQRQIARQFLRQKLGICTRQGQADGVLAARHIEAHAERSALGAVPGDGEHRSVEINCRKGHLRHPLRYGFSSCQRRAGLGWRLFWLGINEFGPLVSKAVGKHFNAGDFTTGFTLNANRKLSRSSAVSISHVAQMAGRRATLLCENVAFSRRQLRQILF